MARRSTFILMLASLVGVGACSSSDSSASTATAESSATITAVTSPPVGSTTTTVAPSTTAAPPKTTVARTTSEPPPPAPTTVAPLETVPPTILPAPRALYTPAPPPATPNATDAIDPASVQADGSLSGVADGTYWGVASGTGDTPQKYVDLRFVQAFFGEACSAQFGGSADACRNDYGTLETPTGTVRLFVGAAAVTVADPSTQASYAIDVAELQRLLASPLGTATPHVGAPEGYIFVPFAFLVRVAGGQIVTAEQVWTP